MSTKNSTNEKKEVIKKRYWAFIVYPESAPENWKEILQQTGLEIAISPLHNKDTDPTGEHKKDHWHCIACYNGPTSANVVTHLTQRLNAPNPQYLESVKGYYRYLSHKDNPEKAQYDENEIVALNGFNIHNFVELSRAEVAEQKRYIQQLIRDLDIVEYCDLLDYLLDNAEFDALDVATNNTLLFNNYIKSRKFKGMNMSKPETEFF